ncbi:accessory factor UbiK family protein [Vibrio sp.]|nr:accessory factor UbiK family protein [Vibrio sp.]
MIDAKKLEQLAKQIQEVMPQPVKNIGADVENKVKQIIQGQLSKLDVVSREEFEIQTQVLLRTRQKITELESKIEKIEAKLNTKETD